MYILSKYWMRDNRNEHRATKIEYRKSCRMISLLFLLLVLFSQYHPVTRAETYRKPTEIKGNYTELIKKGDEAYKENRFSDAEAAYVSALAKKETADVYINLGHVYMMMQDRADDAIEAYVKALDIEPENLKPVRYLGTAYLANEDYRNALRAFKKISRPPELDSDLFISIGICLENLGNSEGSLCAYRNAVTLSPLSKKANLQLASTLHNCGKLEDALSVYGYILQEWPETTEVLIDIGNIYLDKGEYNNAIDTFESAQRLGFGGIKLKRSIADLYLNENMHREAALFYQRFITSAQEASAEDLYRLGNAYYMGGENLSAQEALQKAIDKKPDYGKARLLLGSIYVEELKPDEAQREYKNAIKIEPKLASTHIALANLYIETGEKEKAADEYRIAINLGQKEASIYYNLIVILLTEGRHEESAQLIKEALRLYPQDISLKNLLERVVETAKSNPP
ncbi:MAG: peptidase [Candidatus Scalindua rubra]|uniref:Peptidase n=1 Tax=Candidatus Scalindua rubra TaxID=1872076 RepID=A0A1E3X3C1_9BACT|nr:MAG: peptidase [Candidatus Scalindua rubra]